jgi:hypothetical protein
MCRPVPSAILDREVGLSDDPLRLDDQDLFDEPPPTPSEIRQRAAAIQRQWTPMKRHRRAGIFRPTDLETPEINLRDLVRS